jgi:hypothetical protein
MSVHEHNIQAARFNTHLEVACCSHAQGMMPTRCAVQLQGNLCINCYGLQCIGAASNAINWCWHGSLLAAPAAACLN